MPRPVKFTRKEYKRFLRKREEGKVPKEQLNLLKRIRKLKEKYKKMESWSLKLQERLLKFEGKI